MIYALWLMQINHRIENQKIQFMINPQLHHKNSWVDELRGSLNMHTDDQLSVSNSIWESNDISFLKLIDPSKISIGQTESVQKDKARLEKIENLEDVSISKDEVWDQSHMKCISNFLNKIWNKSCLWSIEKYCKPFDMGKLNLNYK